MQALTTPTEYERTVLAVLHSLGYPQATVSVGVPMFEETLATVPVTVNAGTQFRIGEVTFERANGVKVEDLQAEAALEKGALYRAEDVETARMRLQTRYRREGFTAASFEARENIRAADGLVDVIFAVKEGPRQVIQEITISGLQSVNEEVVRRTVRLEGWRRTSNGRLARCPPPPLRERSVQACRYRGRTAAGGGRYRARQSCASPSRSGRRCACATASRCLKSGRKKTSTGAISSRACPRT